jgi:predicted MFS family arabinose efflux permease
MENNNRKHILPLIVFAQFACTSLWFAGNAVLHDLVVQYRLPSTALGYITSAVQLGFITGTLLFAVFTIADRYSPSKVFFACAIAGAIFNVSLIAATSLTAITATRFITGFCLAGIYPVGMKIAADYHEKGLGKALGYLVGALVLGTAFPHLLKSIGAKFPWKTIIYATSVLSIAGGGIIFLFVPDGPHRTRSVRPDFTAIVRIFKHRPFRSAAFGYFGHMWELYAFWAFVPIWLQTFKTMHVESSLNVPLLSFFIIASGTVACVAGGYISLRKGSFKTAFSALSISFACCLLSPFILQLPLVLFILIMLLWGMAVVADSPQFSTLVAQSAPADVKGTALTIVNCIGFFITILSIQLLGFIQPLIDPRYLFLILATGPLLGLIGMKKSEMR